jgi:hypothetical protein
VCKVVGRCCLIVSLKALCLCVFVSQLTLVIRVVAKGMRGGEEGVSQES